MNRQAARKTQSVYSLEAMHYYTDSTNSSFARREAWGTTHSLCQDPDVKTP